MTQIPATPAPPQSDHATSANPGGLVCRFCNRSPAVAVTVREHHGMLIMMQFVKLKGPFCRVHGMEAVRRMTMKSLVLGWWSLFSFWLVNPLTLLNNLYAWIKIRGLTEPAEGTVNQALPGSQQAPGQ
jgi:hypothetical protein